MISIYLFPLYFLFFFFFFNDTATTEIYTLSLHDALPISLEAQFPDQEFVEIRHPRVESEEDLRSEEHTSELQSQSNLVCRLLLEKKKKKKKKNKKHPVIHYSNLYIDYLYYCLKYFCTAIE